MANYGNMVITQKGQALFAKVQNGEQLKFTRMQIGGGQLPEGQDPTALTALISPISYISISKIFIDSSTAHITGTLDNSQISTPMYSCELGIYATDPDEGEILYGYANAGTQGDTLPPISSGSFSRQFQINATIGNATNVTANIPQSNAGVQSGLALYTNGCYTVQGSGTNTITGGIAGLLSYYNGLKVNLLIQNTNTDVATLNLNSLGVVNIKYVDGNGMKRTLPAGHLIQNSRVMLEYDGTDFIVISNETLTDALIATGSVIWLASLNVPVGYLKANGAAISRVAYAKLFSVIGTTFGVGDGSTTFQLPDLRGYFLRGFDDGRGVDSGRTFGSTQQDDLKSHNHNISTLSVYDTYTTLGPNVTTRPDAGATPQINTTAIQYVGGTETRPKNIALLACIKY